MKNLLIPVILALALILPACSAKDKPTAGILAADNGQVQEAQPEQANPPHAYGSFQGANQSFSGGSPVQDYNLINIRRVPHPSFHRMVFEFGLGQEGSPAQEVPAYKITLDSEQSRLIMDLPGVSWAKAQGLREEIPAIAPLIKKIDFNIKDGGGCQIQLQLQEKAVFQVFDLTQPSRIVIVMAPEA